MPRRKLRGSIPPTPSPVKRVEVEVATQFELSEITGNAYKQVNKKWGAMVKDVKTAIYDCVELHICRPRGITDTKECQKIAKLNWNYYWAILTRALDFSLSGNYSKATVETIAAGMATDLGVPAVVARCIASKVYDWVEANKSRLQTPVS